MSETKHDEHNEASDKGSKKEKKVRTAASETMDRASDEFSRLFRGFFFAGLESLAVMADMTRTFVDKATERNRAENRDTATKTVVNLPTDLADASIDAWDVGIQRTRSIVDKFYEKYKEK